MAEAVNMQELEGVNDLSDYELDFMKRKVVGVVFENFRDARKNVKDDPDNSNEAEKMRILSDLHEFITDFDVRDELFYFAWYRIFDPLEKRGADEWYIEFGRHPHLKDTSDLTLETLSWMKEWDTARIDVVRKFTFPVTRPSGNVSIQDGVKIAYSHADGATSSQKRKRTDGDGCAANSKEPKNTDGDGGRGGP